MPALVALMASIAQRRVRVLEVETQRPSPFAASLLFGYVGAFMYEGDSPLAERGAAALSLDSTLLAELLGRVELRELLDPEVVAATSPGPVARTPSRSGAGPARGPALGAGVVRRLEDIGRLRDGLGIAVPLGVPAAFTEEVADPLGELLGRYARTHTPFSTAEAAARFGLGLRVTADVLGRLADPSTSQGRLVRGDFVAARPSEPGGVLGAEQWCDADVLRILRRRSLAALRALVSRSAPPPTGGSCRPGIGSERPNPGFGARAAGAGPAGARLLPRPAGRTAGHR